MVISRQLFITIIIALCIEHAASKGDVTKASDWRVIEMIAEEHPYIAALLTGDRKYLCTGTIINKQTVLTSGNCIKRIPRYIAVGAAILRQSIYRTSLYDVAYTKLHEDYIFEMEATEPNITQMHSNIGLVFVDEPVLEFCFGSADIGNYYASELREKQLTVVGYGKLRHKNVTVLQKQVYHQTPCVNPKWYYCICGFEYSTRTKTYEHQFGDGAPVIFGTRVVGVAAAPCGTLALHATPIKYNIFTILEPYLQWIEKGEIDPTLRLRAFRSNSDVQEIIFPKYIYVLFIISKLII